MLLIKATHPAPPGSVGYIGITRVGTCWRIGVPNELEGECRSSPKLCSADVFHAYPSMLTALLGCVFHGYYPQYDLLFEAEGDPVVTSSTKVGCRKLTLLRPLQWPESATPQVLEQFRYNFAINLIRWRDYDEVADYLEAGLAAGEFAESLDEKCNLPSHKVDVRYLAMAVKSQLPGSTILASAILSSITTLESCGVVVPVEDMAKAAMNRALTDRNSVV